MLSQNDAEEMNLEFIDTDECLNFRPGEITHSASKARQLAQMQEKIRRGEARCPFSHDKRLKSSHTSHPKMPYNPKPERYVFEEVERVEE